MVDDTLVLVSILQVPSVAVTFHVDVLLSIPRVTLTTEPTSAVPEIVGVVSVVRDALDITGTPSLTTSIIMIRGTASALALPVASVATAVML